MCRYLYTDEFAKGYLLFIKFKQKENFSFLKLTQLLFSKYNLLFFYICNDNHNFSTPRNWRKCCLYSRIFVVKRKLCRILGTEDMLQNELSDFVKKIEKNIKHITEQKLRNIQQLIFPELNVIDYLPWKVPSSGPTSKQFMIKTASCQALFLVLW